MLSSVLENRALRVLVASIAIGVMLFICKRFS